MPMAHRVRSANPRRKPDRLRYGSVSGRLIALLLTRVAAGLGGFIAGTGVVHALLAGNSYGIILLIGGLALLLYGVRQAARLSGKN